MANDKLDEFINGILIEKELPGVDDEVRSYLVADLKERLIDQINRALINELPDDKVDELNIILDNESFTNLELWNFMASTNVDVKAVTARTMLLFRDLYLQKPVEKNL